MNPILAAVFVMAIQSGTAPKLDHIMLGAPDLDRAVAAFLWATNVAPIRGGMHPGRGTQNALVSLGDGTYLEIIAPSKEKTDDELVSMLRKLDGLTPVGWALRVSDAGAVRAELLKQNIEVTPLEPGSRITPTGERLSWMTFDVEGFESAPFFVEWDKTSRHPSTTSPGGCTIKTFSVADPRGAELLSALRAIGADTVVGVSEKAMISVTLQCGKRTATFATH